MAISVRRGFAAAIGEQTARTENNMKTRKSSANACVDFFYSAGAMRGQNIIPAFVAALADNDEYALRLIQWLRDVRGGAGERQLFKDAIVYLAKNHKGAALRILPQIPEIGCWKDMLVLIGTPIEHEALEMIAQALNAGHGLCAKWMPRKGPIAAHLTHQFELTPRQYRKLLVGLTNVVETKMCNRDWENINFNHVPSLAHSRYRKCFFKRSESYKQYVENLKKGEAKINAAAVYPYDVLKQAMRVPPNGQERDVVVAQWNALPDYIGNAHALPIIDVSGSMRVPVGGRGTLTCLEVSLSLGLYMADKNTGPFKDCYVSFSAEPELRQVQGNIVEKLIQVQHSRPWAMNTNFHAALDIIVNTGVEHNVAPEDMPSMLVILSDMQFDQCTQHDDNAMQMIQRKYEAAGYAVPKIVFWNLRDAGNVPMRFDSRGVALVSGYSPSIMKAILANEEFTPETVMLEAIMVDRYRV